MIPSVDATDRRSIVHILVRSELEQPCDMYAKKPLYHCRVEVGTVAW